jgi:DNA-binding transcriptional MerR regulator
MKKGSPKGIPRAKPRTIGRLAEEAGVNVETVRFYERCGLLQQPKAPASGWRVYDPNAVWIVHYVRLGRQLGFTLSELKALLANVGSGRQFCTSVQKAYQEKIRLLEQKIDQMRAMRKDLKKALAACVKRSATGDCPIAQRCGAQFTVPVGQIATRS